MLNYTPSVCGLQFHQSDAVVKIIIGPYGSGKSCCAAVDILTYACAQAPDAQGIRHSRVLVVRSTYNELIMTTRKSLMEVLPDECGTITGGGLSPRGFYDIPLPDNTRVQLELNLLAVQFPDDCNKLRSINATFAWINEGSTVIPEVLPTIQQRIGRFPSMALGGVSWGGVIIDSNMPAHGSWLWDLMNDPPENYLVIKQPPAAFERIDANGNKFYEINSDAENLENLGSVEPGDPTEFISEEEYNLYLQEKGKRYYSNQINTLLRMGRFDVIQNQYCMIDVPIIEGKPVFPEFNLERHVSKQVLEPINFQPILIGSDTSGIHPAAVIIQLQHGRWCILDELYAEGEGLETFLYGMLIPLLREKYRTNRAIAILDPSNPRDAYTAQTPKARFEEAGILSTVEISNSPKVRIGAVSHLLNKYAGGLLVNSTCSMVIRGFQSEYKYRRLKASGTLGAAYTPEPEKNEYSHLLDSVEYACLYILTNETDDTRVKELAGKLTDKRQILKHLI